MMRSAPTSLYDEDLFAWTQDQAAALRQVSSAQCKNLDVAHVAEEIEDLGRRDLREVGTYLERIVEHLIKVAAQPSSRDVLRWRSEIRHSQNSAHKAFSPSMRRLLDMMRIWRDGRRAADAYLTDVGIKHSAAVDTPFDLDELLSADFTVDAALAKLKAEQAKK